MQEIAPVDEKELCGAIADSAAAQTPMEIAGAGSRAGFGRPVEASIRLSTKNLSGVIFYEPAELVLSARAGTPLADVVALVDCQGQELAFEPIDHGRFYGGDPGRGTLGGVIATNASGPRRVKAGAARDHLLGFRGATGRADLVKSGGRVMKNVTGYDLSKLVTGSHGALMVLSEITLKVLPKAETQITFLVACRDEGAGLALLREASGLPYEVSGFALTPQAPGGEPKAALRLEGPEISVNARRDDLLALLRGRKAKVEVLDGEDSRALWANLRDAEFLRASGQIWRLSVAPTDGASVVEAVKRAGVPLQSHFYDWIGGLVWLGVEAAPDAHAPAIRAALEPFGGHATLMRADAQTRRGVAVFHPQSAALAALTARVKDSFDPLRILNRGRMRADL